MIRATREIQAKLNAQGARKIVLSLLASVTNRVEASIAKMVCVLEIQWTKQPWPIRNSRTKTVMVTGAIYCGTLRELQSNAWINARN